MPLHAPDHWKESDERIPLAILPKFPKVSRCAMAHLLRALDHFAFESAGPALTEKALAEFTCYSGRQVRRILAAMRDLGFVEFEPGVARSMAEATTFRICWEKIPLRDPRWRWN